MDAIIGVVAECVKCAIPPFVRQMGYCVHSKKIVEKLVRKVEDLKNTRTDVQNRVTAATNNLESIKNVVEAWLERVEGMGLMNGDEVIDEMIKNQCCKGWCCCCARYSIGRQAQKKIASIDELLNEGKSFVDVSYPSSLLGLELMPITGDSLSFASRESTRNQVMAALKDEGTYLIGIYGMGGVGKTTLMNQVAKQVKEEKIFDVVVITTVSQNVELKRIQGEIAAQLGLNQLKEVDDKSTRAKMLWERLKQEKRILVILDDLWTTDDLDLSGTGIPCGENHHKGCKVLITSRSLELCNSMLSQENIEVGVLSEEDSWHLFKKNAGDVVDSHALQSVANEVVKECGGLPIALVTLGRALRNKGKPVWDDTALQLRRFPYIEGMNSKVFSSIKLSYDHLGNEILKKCFLFCCLFPEDYPIHIDKLMMYVTSDDLILEDLETLKEVRGRLQTVLDKLIASCLLLLVEEEEDGVISRVRMHDVVRDVSIRIASEEANGFLVKAGLGLKTWPKRERLLSTGKCLRLSLMGNEISVLPDQPELPNLLSLSLEVNNSLKKLPDSFFQSMEALVALDISRTGISSLPTSLSFLVNLRSLHLFYCDLHGIDISVIGELKKLEILNLSWCKLFSLPEEIGGLSNLRLLDLSGNYELNFIPPNVISRLSCLEELYMLDSFKRWKLEPTEDGSRASLDEVASLKCVQLEVENDEIKARISTGRGFRKWNLRNSFFLYHNDFGSYLTAPSPICHSIRVLLAIVGELMLSNCTGLKSVGQLVTCDGFNNMKILAVKECNEMEYLMSVVEEKIPTTTFIALEKLCLHGLGNLKEILHGPMPAGFLDKLEQVRVEKCQNLVSIFSPDVWVKLRNLQSLRVEECEKLKEVFYLKEEEEGCRLNKQDGHVDITFPKLKELYFIGLPEVTIIWKGSFPIESLQYLKVVEVTECNGLIYLFSTPTMVLALQQLEELKISNCDGMAAIAAPPEEMVQKDQVLIPPHTSNALPPQLVFPNLRLLVIQRCDSLKDLYPLTKLSHGGLSQLRRLEVWNCTNLEEMFLINTDEEEDHDGKAMMLPQLDYLSLHNLPSLIWNIPIGSLQNLREVSISNCSDSLNHHIFQVSLVISHQLEILEVWGCEDLKAIIDNHISPTDQVFPRLKKMDLWGLPNLMTIANGVIMSFGSFHNLEVLCVGSCNSLKHILPIRLLINGGLPKLKEIWVKECNEMEVIFNEDGGDHDQYNDSKRKMVVAFPHLWRLILVSLPKLSKFHQGPPILDWPSLQYLIVKKCENLKRLPLNHTHSLFPELKEIEGDSERWFEEELEWEDDSLKSRLRPKFMNY